MRTHIDARIPDVSAAHLIDPAWVNHHRAAQRPAVPRNHHINTTRRISYDLSKKLMPKDEWATILGHSPDVADALIQSMILTP